MEDSEKNLFTQELDKSRQLNEALGMGIGIFQVCLGLRDFVCNINFVFSDQSLRLDGSVLSQNFPDSCFVLLIYL